MRHRANTRASGSRLLQEHLALAARRPGQGVLRGAAQDARGRGLAQVVGGACCPHGGRGADRPARLWDFGSPEKESPVKEPVESVSYPSPASTVLSTPSNGGSSVLTTRSEVDSSAWSTLYGVSGRTFDASTKTD